jgi:uncharacterized protein (DUF2252 family)
MIRSVQTPHDDPSSARATWEERREFGRSLRKVAPRSSHAAWMPWSGRRDPIDVLEEQADSREPDLVPIRYGRMLESPFTYLRGSAAVMAMDLATTPVSGIRVQACGDAHVNNFGKFATPERNVVFDINDFDETLPAPWEWDLKRLCVSLHVVARMRGFSRSRTATIVETAARTYRERLRRASTSTALELWYERIDVDHMRREFPESYLPRLEKDLAKARRKDHSRALARLTEQLASTTRFRDDPPLLVHLDDTDSTMDDVLAMVEQYRLSLAEDRRDLFDRFRIVDVARKVVGVGSVGTRCWVVLFEGPDRPGGDHIVLQVKEAQRSVLEPYAGPPTQGHDGIRVVVGQRLTQAASDLFLGWCEGPRTGRHYYVRQLWDVKGQSDVMRMNAAELRYYGSVCAWALARAHARTGDATQLAGYLGGTARVDRAIVEFSAAYARQNAEDHAALVDAVAAGRVQAAVI